MSPVGPPLLPLPHDAANVSQALAEQKSVSAVSANAHAAVSALQHEVCFNAF